MRIGLPREIKDGERRVGLLPDGVGTLVADGHAVAVERGAGAALGIDDAAYAAAGATLVDDPRDVWRATLVVKVKELQPAEYPRLVPGTTVLGYAQLGRDPALLDAVLAARTNVIACEAVRDAAGALPLLAPMSRIAGRLAALLGARTLMSDAGGAGVLATGVDDVPGARVVVVGAGEVGREAARAAARMGARVVVHSRGAARLDALARALAAEGLAVETHAAAPAAALRAAVADADLVVGAVLEPGRLSPKLLAREDVRAMRKGSVLVDVGIDQGGIAATSRMTSLSAPTYVEEGVVHLCVPNLPALVAVSATAAFTAATLPCVRRLANLGIEAALAADPGLAAGVLAWDGGIVHAGLAADTGRTPRALPGHS